LFSVWYYFGPCGQLLPTGKWFSRVKQQKSNQDNQKTVGDNKRAWDSCLKFALWADRITRKRSTGKSPFELVYGLNAVFPINMKLPAYKLLGQFSTNKEALQNRIDELVQLEEDRLMAYTQFTDYQAHIKKVFDRRKKAKNSKLVTWSCCGTRKMRNQVTTTSLTVFGWAHTSLILQWGLTHFSWLIWRVNLWGCHVNGQRLKFFFQ
jgi:hypothetical protein